MLINKKNIIKLDIDKNNSGNYKVKITCNYTVYIKKFASYLLKTYYLIFWKNYLKEKNT